ncbi:MAG: amidohydrolase family protein [Betaproteobacteria bacterium]|nr:amidohydrolase family protein [Betaproteobacteria bacterium]
MKIQVPKGACDTHMHFYDTKIPGAPGTFLPGDFTVPQYRALQKKLGFERVIVVQPNAYADDNTVTVNAIKALGKGAKGVAVVKPDVQEAELKRLTDAGICAVRIMTLHGGMLGFDVMDAVMKRVHPHGWHANIQLDGRELPKYEAQIKRLPGKFVIDHTGKFLEPVAPDHPAFRSLLNLVDTGRCWVKLSAPYETSKTGAPKYEDVGRLAKELVKHAPERMMWASNWPHPSARKPAPPDDVALLDLLADWAPDPKVQKKILADNPAELYGF